MKLNIIVACLVTFAGTDAYNLPTSKSSTPEQHVRSSATSRRGLLSSAAAATTALLFGGSLEEQRGVMGPRVALAVEEKAADPLTPLYFGVGVSLNWLLDYVDD